MKVKLILIGKEGQLEDGGNRVKEYMCERGASRKGGPEKAKWKCLDRERWRLFCYYHSLVNIPRGSRASDRDRIDRNGEIKCSLHVKKLYV